MDSERLKDLEQRVSVIEEQLGIVREKKKSKADANKYKEGKKKDKKEDKKEEKKEDKKRKSKTRDTEERDTEEKKERDTEEKKPDDAERDPKTKSHTNSVSCVIPPDFFSMFNIPTTPMEEQVMEAPKRPEIEVLQERLDFLEHRFERQEKLFAIEMLPGGEIRVYGEPANKRTYFQIVSPYMISLAQHFLDGERKALEQAVKDSYENLAFTGTMIDEMKMLYGVIAGKKP
jgi:hypothetical protein